MPPRLAPWRWEGRSFPAFGVCGTIANLHSLRQRGISLARISYIEMQIDTIHDCRHGEEGEGGAHVVFCPTWRWAWRVLGSA